MYDVIVIGGGAAGMMAAIAAAREKASVLILEHMELCGKKILSTCLLYTSPSPRD